MALCFIYLGGFSMKYSKVLLGAAVALAMAGANAADIERTFTFDLTGTGNFGDKFYGGNLNKSFLDSFTFSITGDSAVSGFAGSQAYLQSGKSYDLNLTSFDLYKG